MKQEHYEDVRSDLQKARKALLKCVEHAASAGFTGHEYLVHVAAAATALRDIAAVEMDLSKDE